MSITFNPAGRFTAKVNCICMDVFMASNDLLPGHEECQGYIEVGPVVPELNLANGNAHHLFDLLGIEFDYDGIIDAAELLAKVAGARRKPLDEFTRATQYDVETPFGVASVACGLTEEQLLRYLSALADVANWAMENDLPIQWA